MGDHDPKALNYVTLECSLPPVYDSYTIRIGLCLLFLRPSGPHVEK